MLHQNVIKHFLKQIKHELYSVQEHKKVFGDLSKDQCPIHSYSLEIIPCYLVLIAHVAKMCFQ